jgi:hypothetical protein
MGIGFAGTRGSLQDFREHLGREVLRRVKLFYSYSHEDSALRDELGKHLASLRRWGAVEDWYDRRILPGTDWETEIDDHIRTSDVILPLVSASFLNSDYCSGVELETALKQHEEGQARIVPVILRPCNWTPSPLGRLQALPTDAKAITTWENQDEALVDVIKGLERVINNIRSR